MDFKKQVLDWLADNNLYPKKVRLYNTRRYGQEVRIYLPSQEFPNTKKSRRRFPTDENGYNSSFGIHYRKITMYIHCSEEDWKSEKEKNFILEQCKTENI